ncbi:PP2C family protein-serine/threonine phosphatase [Streptomyces sp. ODS05-4]|uniref:PP2C family protein-serine/threonine phosphatase n=1 Tax=Streptomyces sp. ODS05-4 TaxID=2944939 RepID=UPI00210F15E4|nr:PP2C family protein-serine/threonine phosphatase [Streptomyces sp. ODS05-4]
MAAATIADVAAGPTVGLLPLVALGPAFAGLTGGPGRTALVGGLALVLCTALGWYDDLLPGRRGTTALVSVAGVTAAGLAAAVMRQRRERELAAVRTIARVAQRVLLRPVPRAAGPLNAAVSYTAAVADARIGGDLYEVVTSPGGVRVIVGDVQGKGLEAVETAADVLGAFREAAHDEPDLLGVSKRLERSMSRALSGERFVTAVIAEIKEDRTVTFFNFGHPAPLIVHPDGTADFVEHQENAPPLGLGLGGGDAQPLQVAFRPGDQLLLYTDGVTEARDGAGDFYPLAARLHLLETESPELALEALHEDIVAHAGGPLGDDAAMLLLRYRSPEAVSSPREATAAPS